MVYYTPDLMACDKRYLQNQFQNWKNNEIFNRTFKLILMFFSVLFPVNSAIIPSIFYELTENYYGGKYGRKHTRKLWCK